ncbi:uncharacterized protein LOC110028565 isoform X2 [Phalaenopsis equestris]|uniref:uncharacterized protein LOC110028565 isoform X2 n=1 Tax=Phalaenopsis equestris TaxID=78828 RepID=UPI0009E2942D|nr:uncharacterized protein LOC110028565 isoform X2 [Phalaenopsis equestris]
MASLALVHAQWSTALHHNRNKQVAVVRRKGIILSSTSHRFPTAFQRFPQRRFSCGFPIGAQERGNGDAAATHEENQLVRIVLQSSLWAAEAVYILWLFFLPYAPGDPVWAIKSNTVNDLMGLSLNFFLILPLANLVGIHVIEAPVLHPMAEGLFNLVIGWTFLFAPLLFTDHRRGRFRGSLDLFFSNTLHGYPTQQPKRQHGPVTSKVIKIRLVDDKRRSVGWLNRWNCVLCFYNLGFLRPSGKRLWGFRWPVAVSGALHRIGTACLCVYMGYHPLCCIPAMVDW